MSTTNDALFAAKQEIVTLYGDKYAQKRVYIKKSKGAQEAHEAIRPTDMSKNIILKKIFII